MEEGNRKVEKGGRKVEEGARKVREGVTKVAGRCRKVVGRWWKVEEGARCSECRCSYRAKQPGRATPQEMQCVMMDAGVCGSGASDGSACIPF